MPVVINEISSNGSSNGSSSNGHAGAAAGSIEAIHLSHFALKINGAQPPGDVLDSALEYTVENSLHLPDMCIIRFQAASPQGDGGVGFPSWVDDETFDIGKAIQVDASGEGQQGTPIFFGEITAVEMDFSGIGVPTLIVRALSKSHRLHRTRRSRSFVQVTDSDIVSRLAGEAGLTADTDATTPVHGWVFQNNQTDWEFLQERAHRCDCLLYAWDSKLYLKKMADHNSAAVTLEWGNSLRSFRPRQNAGLQVSQVTVRGWDRMQKQDIVGQASTPVGTPQIGATPAQSVGAKLGGAAKMTVVDRPTFSQAEADGLAQSYLDDIAGDYIDADGLSYGTPLLLAGKTVEVKGVGSRFSGKYYVTSTTHSYTPAEGYTTQFAVTGKRPGNLLGLLQEEGGTQRSRLGDNIVIGVVTNVNDSEGNQGRVKVKYPVYFNTDSGQEVESDWASIATPMAGPGRGFQYIPEVDDEVLVAFEHGDVRRPYIIGALWNGKDKPPMNTADYVKDGKIIRRLTKTRIGHQMDFNDDASTITVTTAGNHQFVMSDEQKKVGVKILTTGGHVIVADDDDDGKSAIQIRTHDDHKITLADNVNGSVGIGIVDKTGNNKIIINSTDNSITISCQGAMNISAGGKITMEGQMGIDIKSPMPITIHSDAKLDMDATGPTSLKGAIVQIN